MINEISFYSQTKLTKIILGKYPRYYRISVEFFAGLFSISFKPSITYRRPLFET